LSTLVVEAIAISSYRSIRKARPGFRASQQFLAEIWVASVLGNTPT